MRQGFALSVAVVLLAIGFALVYGPAAVAPARAADGDSLPGTATLSGAVQAPKPFKAAPVHLMNADKNVLFMVYTSGGRYRAVNLLPGNYEVTVRAPGLAGDAQKVELAAGARQLAQIFQDDLRFSREITLEAWKRRGIGHILELFVLPFRNLL